MPRLLIVDDDESVRKLMRFRLKDSYDIIDTGAPEEALALALSDKPDAILLDLMMPRFSGFEICQTLSALSFTQLIPIFIVSGESAARYKDFCENLGAKAYFQKPVDFAALQARLARELGAGRIDRRIEPRVRLRIMLKLRGLNAKGAPFETLTVTENVSVHGFACGCPETLTMDSTVDVFFLSQGEKFTGQARVVRKDWPNTPGQLYGFQFIGVPNDWILK
jgi:DNA-binding response OmpR family regulator